MLNKVQIAQKLLNTVPNESDVNLVNEIVSLLKKYQFSEDQINIFLNNQLVVNCKNNVFEVQRVNVNRFWNTQFMHMRSKSIEARRNLLQDGTVENWLDFFEKTLPLMKENNIPREY